MYVCVCVCVCVACVPSAWILVGSAGVGNTRVRPTFAQMPDPGRVQTHAPVTSVGNTACVTSTHELLGATGSGTR